MTPWTAACQASLSITNSRSLLKLMKIELVMPSNHFILCRPLHLPSIFPSIRVFSNESVLCIRWPEYWSFSFSISPSNEYLGLISFRIDWFDLLAFRGILKSLLQCHSSKASILCFEKSLMYQLCLHSLTLCNPMDCNPPGSSVHGILQARILKWAAISLSGGSSLPRYQTHIYCIASRFLTTGPHAKAHNVPAISF